MSIRDLNKIIILSSGLTGEVIFQIDYDDYLNSNCAEGYFDFKLSQLLENEEGAVIKIGYKN